MFSRILIVCVGNICRSPTAEVIFRDRLSGTGVGVESAGIRALVGRPMDPTAAELLGTNYAAAAEHRARQLEPSMLAKSDLILVMERRHLVSVANMLPTARGKIFLLGKWSGDREIPDPYQQQRPAFEHVYQRISDDVDLWRRYL